MKKILLLSDTHGTLDDFALSYLDDADEIWHAGDVGNMKVVETLEKIKPVFGVFGNIDDAGVRSAWPEYQCFEREGVKVLILHIGGYPGRYTRRAKSLIRECGPDLFIAGHSHILKVMYDEKNSLLYINPGAAGKSGFHQVRTMVRFGLDKGEIKDLEIIERKR